MAKTLRRRGYHHGNLREALVAAARRLIAARGPAGFTLSEAARLAGVSAAAPYRHFADRDALLAEVAKRGFAAFDRRLSAAWRGAGHDAGAAFLRMGEAYLAFAREEPGYYAAMFAVRPPAKRQAARKQTSFAALEHAVTQVASGGTLDPRRLPGLGAAARPRQAGGGWPASVRGRPATGGAAARRGGGAPARRRRRRAAGARQGRHGQGRAAGGGATPQAMTACM